MTKTSVRIAALAAMIHVLAHTAPAQTPLGTAFTYQGQLNQAGQPFNGPADLTFDLYDADVGGNLIGTQTLNDVVVSDGLFRVVLNAGGEFGPSAFNGEQRWLEISVNGTPLSPRQEVTATPHAQFALNADRLDGLDSTAFLQSVPVPLTLSGTSDTHIIQGENASATNGVSGVFGLASDATNLGYGVLGQTNSGYGRGVFGYAPAGTGVSYGGWFESSSTSGTGVYGTATADSGVTYGVIGGNFGTGGGGVTGYANSATGDTYGVHGESNSTAGRGVSGLTTAVGGYTTYGVYGESRSDNGAGVYGWSPSASGSTAGGIFKSASTNGAGVYGHATSTSGAADGGRFRTDSISGIGVLGWASASSGSAKGGDFESDSSGGIGVSGYAFSATGQTYGVFGSANSSSGRGVFGYAGASSGGTYGVYAQCNSPSGRAVFGYSNTGSGAGDAVFGQTSATAGRGSVGYATAGSGTTYGVWGQADSTNGRGVFGFAPAGTGLTYGVIGQAGLNGWAVYALGDMGASGLKPFRIDYPSDAENKYLLHYATESPYPQNFYSGNVVTDAEGYAWIELPDYFEEINANFKYQLTVLEDDATPEFVQVKVARKIHGNRFMIMTSAPSVEVSWRIEADRNDAYVRARKPRDVVEKEGTERGTYQHPELYGQPPEMGMNYHMEHECPSPPAQSEATPH